MIPPTRHPLPQVIRKRRRVEQELIRIQGLDGNEQHRLQGLQGRNDIAHVPPLHDKGIICQSRLVGLEGFLLTAFDDFFQHPATLIDEFCCNAHFLQCLPASFHLVPGICQLQFQEFLRCADGFLMGFSPIDTVVPQEIGIFRIPQLITIFPLQHFGLTDIRVVFRLQAALTGKIVIVLVRADVPILPGNLFTKTHSALPDFIEFCISKRRVAFFGLFKENGVGPLGCPVPFADPAGKAAHGIIALSLGNAVCPGFPVLQHLVNRHFPILP